MRDRKVHVQFVMSRPTEPEAISRKGCLGSLDLRRSDCAGEGGSGLLIGCTVKAMLFMQILLFQCKPFCDSVVMQMPDLC